MGLYSSRIATKKMVPLCRQMATSYEAGIPIIESLRFSKEQARDRTIKGVLERMEDGLKRGQTLSQASHNESKYLSPFFVSLLSSGEQGGRLDVMLRDLAQYYEDRLAMQRQIIANLLYPCILLTFAWFLGTFALGLVTKLGSLFSRGAGTDPMSFIMEYVHRYLIFQAGCMGLLGVGIIVSIVLARAGLFGYVSGLFTTFLWPISIVTRKFAMARFYRSLALLLSSGLPMTKCLETSAGITGNAYIERDLLKTIPLIKDGQTLTAALSQSKYVSPMGREMIMVGEQSGNLEGQLAKAASYNLQEADHAVQVATKVLYSGIVLGVGGLIGYIVITFWVNFYGSMLDGLGI